MMMLLSMLAIMELFLLFLITSLGLGLTDNDESFVLKLSDFLFTEGSSFRLRVRTIAFFFRCLLFSLLVLGAILTFFTVIFTFFTFSVLSFVTSSWFSGSISSVTLLTSSLLISGLIGFFGFRSLSKRGWLALDFDWGLRSFLNWSRDRSRLNHNWNGVSMENRCLNWSWDFDLFFLNWFRFGLNLFLEDIINDLFLVSYQSDSIVSMLLNISSKSFLKLSIISEVLQSVGESDDSLIDCVVGSFGLFKCAPKSCNLVSIIDLDSWVEESDSSCENFQLLQLIVAIKGGIFGIGLLKEWCCFF